MRDGGAVDAPEGKPPRVLPQLSVSPVLSVKARPPPERFTPQGEQGSAPGLGQPAGGLRQGNNSPGEGP